MTHPPASGHDHRPTGAVVVTRTQLVLVGAVAVAVRLVYVLVVRPDIPFVGDGQTYHLLANAIADGEGYVAPYDWFVRGHLRPTAEFGPVHPSVLAIASLVGVDTVLGHQVWLALVGSVTPVLTALLAGRVTGDRRLALAAGLVAAVHPLLFGSDGALMSETVYTLLGLVALLCLLQDGWRWLVVAGLAIGLAVLTRGDGLLLLPLVALPLLWRRWRSLAVVAVLVVAVVSPWLVRNAVRFDGRLVLSNNVGSLLNGSNCPETYAGPRLGSWDFRCAYRADLPGEDEAESSAVLRAKGLRYLRDHAERLLVVVPARVGRAWGLFHPFGQARAEEDDGRVFATQATGVALDWVLLPLFVVGVVALRRRAVPLVGPVLLVTLLVAASYGNSRFRELAEPALIVGAVAGARVVLTALTERR